MEIANQIIKLLESKVTFSDLQIKTGSPLMYRAPKGYLPYGETPLTTEDVEGFAELADPKWAEKLGTGQFDAAFTIKGRVRLRCNFFRYGHNNDMGVVARKHSLEVPNFDSLGAPTKLRHLVNMKPKGMILITGPFGSGKSTTIASLLDHVNNTMSASIVTLEDPIEYIIESKKSVITQREVPTNVATFSDGLTGAKRQRPDIIMVGEMRDRDTIEAGIMAADSGCLVLSSMHGRCATEAVETLLSYFSGTEQEHKRGMLANSIAAVVSQVLLPSIDGRNFVLGYEMMVNNPGASKLIRENKLLQIRSNIESSATDGSVLMNSVLASLVLGQRVSRDEAMRAAYDKEGLSKLLADTKKV